MPQKSILQEAIANPGKRPIVFILSIGLLLAVAANGLSTLILEVLGTWVQTKFGVDKAIWQLCVVGLFTISLILGLRRVKVPKIFYPILNPVPNVVSMKGKTFEGLVVFVSLGSNPPAKLAIDHNWDNGNGKLVHCWVIGTNDSFPTVEKMLNECEQAGMRSDIFHYGKKYPMTNLDSPGYQIDMVLTNGQMNDPNYIRNLINSIYEDAWEKFGLDESQIIVDYTGGSKSVTAGMVLACASPDRIMQYVVSEYNRETNTIIKSEVNEVRISYYVKPVSS
jgi:CRISPR-associated protein (Cas_Cas02710)